MIRRTAPAAIVCAVVLSASALAGCAKYNGDQAAFCAMLPSAPSFGQLALKMASNTPAQAADAFDDAAVRFRAMERTAPRTIRAKIAALGDSAERLADQLRSPETARQLRSEESAATTLPFSGNPLQSQSPYGYSSQSQVSGPYQLLLNEFANHPGTMDAARSLAAFAENKCDITSKDDPYSVYGVPQSDPGTPYGQQPDLSDPNPQYTVPGQTVPGQTVPSQPVPGQREPSLIPPATAVPTTAPGAPPN